MTTTGCPLSRVADRTTASESLRDVVIRNWCLILRRPDAGLADNFFELGGTSLKAIVFVSALNEALGLGIDARFIFAHPTLAAFLQAAARLPHARGDHPHEQPLQRDCWPLLPSHSWFFGRQFVEPERFCFGMTLRIPRAARLDVLRRAITFVVDRHDALRTQFRHGPRGWEQVAADDDLEIEHRDLTALDPDAQRARIRAMGVAMAGTLEFATGLLVRFATLDLGPDRGVRLLIVCHQLIADHQSFRILLHDIETAYRCAMGERGRDAQPLPRTTGAREWATFVNGAEVAAQAVRDAEYWQTPRSPMQLPSDARDGDRGQDDIRRLLGAGGASEIVRSARTRQVNPDVMLLAAFAHVVGEWCGTNHVAVDTIADGRNPAPRGMNLSRTIGWLTLQAPLYVDLPDGHTSSCVLRSVADAIDRRPATLGYSILRFGSAAARPRDVSQPFDGQVGFNYLGSSNPRWRVSLFGRADEDTGIRREQSSHRPLKLLCAIEPTHVQLVWTFDSGLFARSTIERLATRFEHQVLALAAAR